MDKWQNIRNFKFSSVKEFNSNDFVFLVHAIDLSDSLLSDFHLNTLLKDYGDNYDSHQRIDLTSNPERIAEKNMLSCSLVAKRGDIEVLETYKPFGFIIKCSVENIIMASRQDLGTQYTHPDEVRQKYRDEIIMSFDDIVLLGEDDQEIIYSRLCEELKNYKDKKVLTSEDKIESFEGWNEVLVDGSTNYGKVEIEGIFVNLGHFSMNDESYAKSVIREAKNLEYRLGIPLVYFPKKKYVVEDRQIEIIYDSYLGEETFLKEIAFSKNGKTLRLYVGHDNTPVLQSSTNGMMKLMNSEEFALFLKEIDKLSSDELLKHADLISQLPQIFENQCSNARDAEEFHQVLGSRQSFTQNGDDYVHFFDTLPSIIENNADKQQRK